MKRGLALLGAALALAPVAAAAPRAAVVHGRIELDGKPFFPVMGWLQCPSVMDESVRLGVDVFLGNGCQNPDAEEVNVDRTRAAATVVVAGRTLRLSLPPLGVRLGNIGLR